jgi:TrmH family RNA methyltransferase
MLTEITSLRHPLVQELIELRTEKTARLASNSVLLIGEKMVFELSTKVDLKMLITVEPLPQIKAQKYFLVTPEILKKITNLPAPDGYAAVAPLPAPQSLLKRGRLLILDGLSDPGNLGTLLRTALALDWDGVCFTPGTVDPFNDKALRASKGALFSLPFSEQAVDPLPAHIYLADLEGTPLSEAHIQRPLALILSNEGSGPSSWAKKIGQRICIPMHNGVDSLNVAASGAIFLYLLKNKNPTEKRRTIVKNTFPPATW